MKKIRIDNMSDLISDKIDRLDVEINRLKIAKRKWKKLFIKMKNANDDSNYNWQPQRVDFIHISETGTMSDDYSEKLNKLK